MKKYAIKRILQLIPILFAITFLSYGMMRIAGSDVVTRKMENTGGVVSEAELDAAREELGLDKPFLTQYFVWLGKLLRGDMGNSYVSGVSVFDTFISKLPATLLLTAIAMSAKYLRQVRATVLDELSKDYVTGARARGVKFSVTLWKSIMKASLVTVITLLMLSVGNLLGGTAIVESIFMWDGVGKMAVDAISMRDYPIIQAYVMWMAIIYVLVNLLTDLSYRFLDPRIRLGGAKQ